MEMELISKLLTNVRYVIQDSATEIGNGSFEMSCHEIKKNEHK